MLTRERQWKKIGNSSKWNESSEYTNFRALLLCSLKNTNS